MAWTNVANIKGSNAANPAFTAAANGLAAGASPTVSVSGTYPNLTLTFGVPAGATGATGPRGTNWYTGSGAPGTISGSLPGDLYLDTATGNVYTLS